jgi:pseudouridine-5'-phosphate glycosidase
MNIHINAQVEAALHTGSPVVALESAVVTHGLPYPRNLELAREMERIIANMGATPATIALIGGQIRVGLSAEDLIHLAESPHPRKVSLRDLAACVVGGEDGGTTVAATAFIAQRAGIQVFVTGGIGGVHRGQPFDISADLPVLASTPIAVVCSGAKSILDLPLTLEWLETHGVPVVGYGTDQFPAFYSRQSGLPVDFRAESVGQIAEFSRAHWDLGLKSAVVVGVPAPEESAIPQDVAEDAIGRALAAAERDGIHGKATTPYLLSRMARLTGGLSMQANLALLTHNARVGVELAVSLAQREERKSE